MLLTPLLFMFIWDFFDIPFKSLDLRRFVHYFVRCASSFEIVFSIRISEIARSLSQSRLWDRMGTRSSPDISETIVALSLNWSPKKPYSFPRWIHRPSTATSHIFCNTYLASSNLGSSMDIRFQSTWKSSRQLRFWSFNSC